MFATEASATSRDSYLTSAALIVRSDGGATASASWSETFRNSSAETLLYSFTYRIGMGSLSADFGFPGAQGTAQSSFESKFSVTIGSGATADYIVSRQLVSTKAVGSDAVSTQSGTGGALVGEIETDTVRGGITAWDDTYITIEIGAISAGEIFKLDSLFFASSLNRLVGTCDESCATYANSNIFRVSDPRVGLFSRKLDAAVPEPASLSVIAFGLAALGLSRRRKRYSL
jgi:hypothetical protein